MIIDAVDYNTINFIFGKFNLITEDFGGLLDASFMVGVSGWFLG